MKISESNFPESKNTFVFAQVMVQVMVSVVRVWGLTLIYALTPRQSSSLGINACQSCVKRPEQCTKRQRFMIFKPDRAL